MFKKKQLDFSSFNKFSAFNSNQKGNSSFADSNNPNGNSYKGTSKQKLTYANLNRSNHSNNQQGEDSSSEKSTYSFNQYKQILNNLFENEQHDEEWSQVPEILKLITKALVLSVNAVENKVIETKQIVNDQGIKIMESSLAYQNLQKQIRRFNDKVTQLNSLQRQDNGQIHKRFLNSGKKDDVDFYAKGLDVIMIEEVKTITDAMVSKKSAQIISQVQKLNENSQNKFKSQIQKVKHSLTQQFISNTKFSQIQAQLSMNSDNLQKKLQQRVNLLEMQIQHLSKQLMDEKQAMCNLAHYAEEKYCSKEQANDILRSNLQQRNNKSQDKNLQSDMVLSRNKIQQIITIQVQNYSYLKRKEFQEFKEKILKSINSFATIPQVQKIVQKSSKTKIQKIQEMNQMYMRHDLAQDKETVDMKKTKSNQIKSEADSRERSPLSKKKSVVSKKSSSGGVQLIKGSKNTTNAKKITPFNQCITENSPLIYQKVSRGKVTKQPQQKSITYEPQIDFELIISKVQTRTNIKIQALNEQFKRQVTDETQKLQKRLLKRLLVAEQEFCHVVEENWRTMSESNLKIQKKEKQNMENLLHLFSVLNVIARYTTVVNCQANSCIKWQKEVFNATNKSFYLNNDKSHIYITAPGVYHINVVLYTLYDPVVEFAVELNSEQVFANTQLKGPKEESAVESQVNQRKGIKAKKVQLTLNHPSRGTQFSQTLLVPAKSHLVVRMLKPINGQALIEIRKL